MNRRKSVRYSLLLLPLSVAPAAAQDFLFTSGLFVPNVTAPEPLQAGDTLQINAGSSKIFSAVSFTNLGQVDWNADSLFLQSGASINNGGLWQIGGDFTLINNGGTLPVFTNTGTLRKTAGAGAATIGGVAFVNTGIIDVLTGTLDFSGGNATFNAGTSFTGSGASRILSNATFNGAFTSSNLVLAAGTVTGNAAVLSGAVSFTGGTLGGSWSTAAGHTLTAHDGTSKIMSGLAFTNLGTFDWATTDSLFMQSGTSLDNQGTFLASENMSIVNNGGTLPTFTNNGTFAVAAGKAVSMGSVAFVNNATIDVAGTLNLNGHNATFNAGSTFTGNGVVAVNSNASFNGAITASPTLSLRAGIFTGANDFVIGGNPEWTGGTLTGQWTLAAGQTLTARDGTSKIMSGLAFTNLGNFVWETTDSLFLQSASSFDNQGSFLASENMSIVNNGGTLPTFTNNGTFAVAAGKAVSMGSVAFVNNATIDVAGTLNLNGHNATFNAGSTFTGNGVVAVNSNASFNGAITASPTLSLRAGIFTGANDFVIGGNPEWTGGTLTGQWTLAAGHTLTAHDGTSKIMSGLAFTNLGTLDWDTGNTLFVQSGTHIVNQGRIDSKTDHAIVNNGGSASTFVNDGLIVKTGGTGTTSIGNSLGFVNTASGVIDVRTGTLALPSNFGNDGTLMGTGTFATNTLTNNGHVAPGASPGTLAIAGNFTQTALGTLDIELESLLSTDLLTVSGITTLDGTLALHCFGNCVFDIGEEITILNGTGNLLGEFSTIAYFGFGSGEFDVLYDRVNEDVILRALSATSPVPLPAPVWMLLGGLAVLARRVRR